MRANEEEIPSVPDTAPKAVQKLQKAKNKPSVQEILDSIEPPSSTYRPIQVEDRLSQPKLPSGLVTPLDFFSLFITSSMLEQISEFTNTKAQKAERTAKQRLWVPTSGAEIGVFMGILLSMGLISINRTKSYWDTHSDMHGNPEIPQAMSLNRFEQIKRFLKLSDPNTNPEPKSSGYEKLWTAKLKPFSTLFQQACKQYLHSGRNVSVDEQLILFKGRFKHTMNIPSKEADRGFKIYCLCSENYLYAFMYASKTTKIVDLHQIQDFSPSTSMIVQIVKSLPQPYEYVVYLNNFFSSIDLFMALKALGMRAVKTAKQGSEFDENLLKLKAVATKEKNWGTTAVTTVNNHVLCMAWQNNNTVLLMTTAHWPGEAQKIVPRDSRFRHHISEDFVQLDSKKQPNFTLSTSSGGLQFTHEGSRRKCSTKGTLFPRQTSMSTLLVIPVSVSSRSSCSECLHSLQAQLSYEQNDTRSISEGGDYFADAKSS